MAFLKEFNFALNAIQTEDVNILFEKEKNKLKSIRYIRNFNNRKCNCCNCDNDYNNTWYCFLQNDSDENDSDEDDSENEKCVCNCLYPPYITNPLQLNDTQILRLIDYLKEKDVNISKYDFQWDNWNNLDDFIVNKFGLTVETIENYRQEYKKTQLEIFSTNYNILRILSGMGELNYSS